MYDVFKFFPTRASSEFVKASQLATIHMAIYKDEIIHSCIRT